MLWIKIVTIVLSLLVTGLGLTAQVKKNRVRRSVEGLSLFYFLLLAISYSFWSIYGVTQRDIVLIIPMSLGMVVSWIIVCQFWLYRNK